MNAVRQEDENTKQIRDPLLYNNGQTASGKSAILIEIAIKCARDENLNVIIDRVKGGEGIVLLCVHFTVDADTCCPRSPVPQANCIRKLCVGGVAGGPQAFQQNGWLKLWPTRIFNRLHPP